MSALRNGCPTFQAVFHLLCLRRYIKIIQVAHGVALFDFKANSNLLKSVVKDIEHLNMLNNITIEHSTLFLQVSRSILPSLLFLKMCSNFIFKLMTDFDFCQV